MDTSLPGSPSTCWRRSVPARWLQSVSSAGRPPGLLPSGGRGFATRGREHYPECVKPRYPLESLRSLRHQRVEESSAAVARQAERTRRAQQRHVLARAASSDEQARNHCVTAAERERLERGMLRAGDLQRHADWSLGAEQRERQLEEQEARAAQKMQAAERLEAELRSALVGVDADAKVVDEHRNRWHASEKKRERQATEEAADELYGASRAGERLAAREREGKQ